MKIDGNQLRTGMIIEYQAKLWRVANYKHVRTGMGRAYLQVELRDIKTGTKLNDRFRSEEAVERVQLDSRRYQYLFSDEHSYTFMDTQTFDQIVLDKSVIDAEQARFLKDGMEVTIESYEEKPISMQLPDTVILQVTEADAVVKRQTASSSYKPALLENGLRVLVPPHIEAGTRIVVNTAEATYVERAKD